MILKVYKKIISWLVSERPHMLCLVLSTRVSLLFNLSNGGLDPWSAGGVTHNITDSLVSIMIPDGAHHLDLRYSNDLDPPSVRAARALELKYFREWIKRAQKNGSN